MRKKIYIILFAVLYLVVAFSSLWHAIEFFGLANGGWMAVILAGAFEVGQAAVLFALLSNTKDRKKVMPWVLMTMFTLVQVLGNVYSSYKHIMLNSIDNLKYFKEPVFIWTELPDAQATVIITYLVGGLLPVSALLLTSMLTSFLTDEDTAQPDKKKDEEDVNADDNVIDDNVIDDNVIDDNVATDENTNEDIVDDNNVDNNTDDNTVNDNIIDDNIIDDNAATIKDMSDDIITDSAAEPLTVVDESINETNENDVKQKNQTRLLSL